MPLKRQTKSRLAPHFLEINIGIGDMGGNALISH